MRVLLVLLVIALWVVPSSVPCREPDGSTCPTSHRAAAAPTPRPEPAVAIRPPHKIGTVPGSVAVVAPFQGCRPTWFWRGEQLCVVQGTTGSAPRMRCHDPQTGRWHRAEKTIRPAALCDGAAPALPANHLGAAVGPGRLLYLEPETGLVMRMDVEGRTHPASDTEIATVSARSAGTVARAGNVFCRPSENGRLACGQDGDSSFELFLGDGFPEHPAETETLSSPSGRWLALLTQERWARYDDSGKGSTGSLVEPGSEWELWLAEVTPEPRGDSSAR